ncbi:type II secretion system minor pseudopilin GspK [Alteromonas sp. a30]|uniref:type II secretion system minor pseudopilin GspK n=1 Tax=Alteromonas sp. a30 TaxID=2730917 RepID=UPI00227FED28|nr:type II secretion system minor pseudopilin GspK [Alteromonas sp. a30]MCY7295665.1 type II secretion system minor pseudopilin GspK [Alteromonas sp. a30]
MKQRGVALIVVLLIVAMVTIIATEMAGRLQIQVRRAANLKDGNQAYWYAMGAEEYAAIAIRKLLEEDEDIIHIKQPWASSELAFPLPGGGIQAQLEDMQSCFNLNALAEGGEQGNANGNANGNNNQGNNNTGGNNQNNRGSNQQNGIDGLATAFHRLLRSQELNVPSLSADTLKDSLVDWLDEDSNLSGSFGAEDPDYESKQHPYLAANGLMTNKTELRLVKGAELPWISELMKYVCVIPNETALKINVNTLTPERAPLLAALTGMSVADANNLISNIPYDKKEDFLTQSEVASQGLSDEQQAWFDVTTRYFILHTKASYNNASFAMSTVFKVDESDNVQIIRREFGGKL